MTWPDVPSAANAGATKLPLPSAKPVALTDVSLSHSAGEAIGEGLNTLNTAMLPTPRPQQVIDLANWPKYMIPRHDVGAYKSAFEKMRAGKLSSAQSEINSLSDKRLVGYLEFEKLMHPTAYRASFVELRSWLKSYSDHAGAERVYDLADRRRPSDYRAARKPSIKKGTSGSLDRTAGTQVSSYVSPRKRSSAERRAVRNIKRNISRNIYAGSPTKAWTYLNAEAQQQKLDQVEFDILRADIAQAYYLSGKVDEAYLHSKSAVVRSGDDAPLAGWVAGLSAWQNGRKSDAAVYFERTAKSPRATPWMVSAGAYWASRAFAATGQRRDRKAMLKLAAEHPYTFYGMIASRTLKQKPDMFRWDMPAFDEKHFEVLSTDKIGRRAIGLIQVGEMELAERELRQIRLAHKPKMQEAVLAVASEYKMPALALQIASGVTHADGSLIDAALYPELPWQPEGGYTIDRALVHAFVRQESRFDPNVQSHSGAVGLMQLMPRTASYVASKRSNAYTSRSGRRALSQPEYNLSLGQRYIQTLLRDGRIDGDLLRLTMAYNAGPGRLGRWDREINHGGDMLLMIESIPSAETRAFVERVMANYWIYRIRMGQDTPSLDALVKSGAAEYVSLDEPSAIELAADNRAAFN